MEPQKPSDKILRELRRQAQYVTQRIVGQYQAHLIRSWDDIERMFGISIPEHFKKMPFNYSSLSLFNQFWVASYETRIQVDQQQVTKKLTLVPESECTAFGNIRLRPRQEPVFRELRDAFFNRGRRALLQDGQTGSGKSYVGAALIRWLVDHGILTRPEVFWRLHPFIIFCPKAVAEKWRRTIEAFGMGKLLSQRKILIFESTAFSTIMGKMFIDEEEDLINETISLVWKETMIPYFCIIDECHEYVRRGSKRTQCMEALVDSIAEYLLFMSATPIECVNDSYIFVRATRMTFQGMRIGKNNFDIFAQAHDDEPNKPNATAVKRLRATLADYIVSMPYAKPRHHANNIVQVIDFEKSEDIRIYKTSYERYLEVCTKVGKDPTRGRFAKAIALNKFRHSVEPLRGYYPAKKAAENFFERRASTIVGCAFKETIATIMFKLIDIYHVPREKISVIWGGRKDVKQSDILPPEQISSIVQTLDLDMFLNNPDMVKKLKMTLKYRQDQFEHGEDEAQQRYRHEKLRSFGLTGTQSENARQIEIDRFMEGTTEICLMTVDTGGIGLDLDCKFPHILPRDCYFTQIYSGRKFLQLLGRSVREDSIADADQYLLMMRDTVEEYHVAPILDAKLKSTGAFTNRTFDIVDILENKDIPVSLQKIRSAAEVKNELAAPDAIIPEIQHDTSGDDEDDDNLEEI